MENRAHCGIARRGRHRSEQRRRPNVIRARALRILGLVFLPVWMHSGEEFVQNQTAVNVDARS